MKLPIEPWIEERYHSPNVSELMRESVVCYRNEAYRASLLLSYLGFLTIIKDIMNKSKPPAGFEVSEWKDKVKEINSHDSWETAVYDSLMQGSKPRVKEIFRLNDDLKQQLAYWRSRRNDAAHYKDNEINGYHTETFWSFMKSNLPKIAVNGGMQGLLNKFSEHFDENQTAPNTDFKPLVKEIPSTVLTAELADFFLRLKRVIDGRLWYDDAISSKVFNEIFNLNDDRVIKGLRAFFREDNRDLKFLNAFPVRVRDMDYDTAEMRKIWKSRMFSAALNINPFTIYCELLRQKLIPKEEISATNLVIFNAYDQQGYHKLPANDADIKLLLDVGFFEIVFEEAIVNQDLRKFKWVNSKCDLIAMMVEHYPLRKETVVSICKNPGSAWPSEWLIRELQRLFAEKAQLKMNFGRIAAIAQINVPDVFN